MKAWSQTNGVVIAPATALVTPTPDTPVAWFDARFPGLKERHGDPVQEVSAGNKKEDRPFVKDLSEDFLAATLGEAGSPEAPTVFVTEENRFYTYSQENGIFSERREATLATMLSELLLKCARACEVKFDTRSLEFQFRDSSSLKGVLSRARGLLEVPPGYFETDLMKFVPCNNGMLRLADKVLLPFSPIHRRRNKLAVAYDPTATSPMFLDGLLRPALDPDDVELLQRWCGLALIGTNLAQRLIILTGTAGGGKGTFVRVLNGIIGAANVGTIRPDYLGERFELGRLLGKSLLYGADVPENFLNGKGASVLKALTGGDPVTLEFKGSNERPEIICRFNAIVTCNSRLTVHLEGDTDAWNRRLIIFKYQKAKPAQVIPDLSERILSDEGAGVLNWMLEGLEKIRADDWQLRLTAAQQKLVDDLLQESDAVAVFAKEHLRKDEAASLSAAQCHQGYVNFCDSRNWTVLPKKIFATSITEMITRQFGLAQRNDIADEHGKAQRGWKGIRCL